MLAFFSKLTILNKQEELQILIKLWTLYFSRQIERRQFLPDSVKHTLTLEILGESLQGYRSFAEAKKKESTALNWSNLS